MEADKKWYQLDNAAKIIPSTAHGANTRVFRLSCVLYEPVEPALLQEALDQMMEEEPFFACCLKRGLFWYYLEESDIRPMVEEDILPPCSPLFFPGRRNLLFRVTYYKTRINLEMFHVLADGTGAYAFFREMVARYLAKAHHLPDKGLKFTSAQEDRVGDAFSRYYEGKQKLDQLHSMERGKAYQLKGEMDKNMESHLVEGVVPASKFMEKAKEYGATAGVFSTSLYIKAIMEEMTVQELKKQQVVASVPVNLRQFFRSDTIRNFFGVINVSYSPSQDGTGLEDVVRKVKHSFALQLSEDKVAGTMNSYSALEHIWAVKVVPIWVKDLVISRIDHLAKTGVTGTVSNLGRISMPPEFSPYISYFSTFMTAYRQQVCACTFEDKMVFGEASPFTTHGVMRHMFRQMAQMGIPVSVSTNDYNMEEREGRE